MGQNESHIIKGFTSSFSVFDARHAFQAVASQQAWQGGRDDFMSEGIEYARDDNDVAIVSRKKHEY